MQSEQRLRKAVSDVSSEIFKYGSMDMKAISSSAVLEVKQAECQCCGLKEDCTQDYISKIKGSHSGNWVCGLCSEAVKETLEHGPKMAMQEAVSSHKDFCQKYNTTTRLNPKLSLTCAMRDIAKKSSEKRDSKNSSISKIGRSSSCVPRIDLKK